MIREAHTRMEVWHAAPNGSRFLATVAILPEMTERDRDNAAREARNAYTRAGLAAPEIRVLHVPATAAEPARVASRRRH